MAGISGVWESISTLRITVVHLSSAVGGRAILRRSRWPQLQMLSSDSDLERSGRLSFEPRDAAVHAPGAVVRAVVTDLVEGGEVLEGRTVTKLQNFSYEFDVLDKSLINS